MATLINERCHHPGCKNAGAFYNCVHVWPTAAQMKAMGYTRDKLQPLSTVLQWPKCIVHALEGTTLKPVLVTGTAVKDEIESYAKHVGGWDVDWSSAKINIIVAPNEPVGDEPNAPVKKGV